MENSESTMITGNGILYKKEHLIPDGVFSSVHEVVALPTKDETLLEKLYVVKLVKMEKLLNKQVYKDPKDFIDGEIENSKKLIG